MSKKLTLTQSTTVPLSQLQLKTAMLTYLNELDHQDQTHSTNHTTGSNLVIKGSKDKAESPLHKSWSINKRLTLIGSKDNTDIKLKDSTVSRQHAQIEVDQNGYRIQDTNSKNGVFINHTRVLSAYLNDGDILQIGNISLLFQLQSTSSHFPLWQSDHFGELYGTSNLMRELFALLHRVSQSNTTVLIEGESGTGKELAARAIHQHSPRSQQPFIVFDCSAVPNHLIESELFGHAKGSFTGATDKRAGAFLAAQGGTIFLDEIGELPLELQPKLLRVLERGEIKSVGVDHYQTVDVRVICATHRKLDLEVDAQNFRLDLFYRLAVVRIEMPPLRLHKEDIPGLVEQLLEQLSPLSPKEISFKTMNLLIHHDWQGNVRELKNYVHRAIALSTPQSSHLDTQFLLPPKLKEMNRTSDLNHNSDTETLYVTSNDKPFTHLDENRIQWSQTVDINQDFKEAKSSLVNTFEKMYWIALMDKNQGNISACARTAGIHRKSAEYIVKKLGIRSKKRDE